MGTATYRRQEHTHNRPESRAVRCVWCSDRGCVICGEPIKCMFNQPPPVPVEPPSDYPMDWDEPDFSPF